MISLHYRAVVHDRGSCSLRSLETTFFESPRPCRVISGPPDERRPFNPHDNGTTFARPPHVCLISPGYLLAKATCLISEEAQIYLARYSRRYTCPWRIRWMRDGFIVASYLTRSRIHHDSNVRDSREGRISLPLGLPHFHGWIKGRSKLIHALWLSFSGPPVFRVPIWTLSET